MVTIREIMRHDVVTLPYGSSVVEAAKTYPTCNPDRKMVLLR